MARATEVKCQLTERLKKPAGLTLCVPCQFLKLNRSSSLETKTPTLQAIAIASARNLQSFVLRHAPSAIRTPIASGVKSVVSCWYLAKNAARLAELVCASNLSLSSTTSSSTSVSADTNKVWMPRADIKALRGTDDGRSTALIHVLVSKTARFSRLKTYFQM